MVLCNMRAYSSIKRLSRAILYSHENTHHFGVSKSICCIVTLVILYFPQILYILSQIFTKMSRIIFQTSWKMCRIRLDGGQRQKSAEQY